MTTAGALQARLTPVLELDDADVAAWQALAARAAEPNPYLEPGFVVPAVRHLDADVDLLGVWSGDELVLAAPVVARPRWRKLPIRVRAVWCHDHCPIGTPLLDPDPVLGAAAWEHALAALRDAPDRPHLAVLERITTGGAVAAALAEAPTARRVRTYEAYETAVLERGSDASGSGRGISGRHRRELRRRARVAADALGGLELRDLGVDEGAIDAFLALEAAGWKGAEGTALASSPATRAFAVDAYQAFLDQGRAQLLALVSPAGPAAMLWVIRTGATLSMVKMAYDESLAQHSPGVLLVLDLIAWFGADESLDLVDTCAAPDNTLANRLFPDRRALGVLLVPFDRRGRALATTAPPLVALTRRVTRRGE